MLVFGGVASLSFLKSKIPLIEKNVPNWMVEGEVVTFFATQVVDTRGIGFSAVKYFGGVNQFQQRLLRVTHLCTPKFILTF